MSIWQAIVLGAVQGFAEFLPISSSGHLILFQHWFKIENNVMFYSVMLHIGTLIPVVIVLWKEIVALFKKPFNKMLYLIIATVPAGVIGIIFALFLDLDTLFSEHIWLLAVSFAFTAAEMLFAEFRAKKTEMLNPINCKTALIMGCGQAVGVFPGISRSGTTTTFGVIGKVDKDANASFTFLMSIPVILAAALLESVKCVKAGTIGEVSVLPLVFGVITAAVTGYIAISFMLKLIKKANYKWFSLYLALMCVATVITAVAEA